MKKIPNDLRRQETSTVSENGDWLRDRAEGEMSVVIRFQTVLARLAAVGVSIVGKLGCGQRTREATEAGSQQQVAHR